MFVQHGCSIAVNRYTAYMVYVLYFPLRTTVLKLADKKSTRSERTVTRDGLLQPACCSHMQVFLFWISRNILLCMILALVHFDCYTSTGGAIVQVQTLDFSEVQTWLDMETSEDNRVEKKGGIQFIIFLAITRSTLGLGISIKAV